MPGPDRDTHTLSPAKMAAVDQAIEHARAAVEAYRALTRSTMKSLAALREMRASGQMSAADAMDLREGVKVWQAVSTIMRPDGPH